MHQRVQLTPNARVVGLELQESRPTHFVQAQAPLQPEPRRGQRSCLVTTRGGRGEERGCKGSEQGAEDGLWVHGDAEDCLAQATDLTSGKHAVRRCAKVRHGAPCFMTSNELHILPPAMPPQQGPDCIMELVWRRGGQQCAARGIALVCT